MGKHWFLLPALICLAIPAGAQIHPPRPGFNLMSEQQDIQLGKEAGAEVEQKYPVIRNSEVNAYLGSIGQRLARTKYAGDYPYTFGLISDKAINAFSLPGGPVYVNTGLIQACQNEAQLAGVLAHEMSHVTLRHATSQLSKQKAVELPVMLAQSLTGNSIFGALLRAGIGVGANSVLLKFSRTDEAQADYNGALIMYEAGYNPTEMARFFKQLEEQTGRQGMLSTFLSDHPSPGNRVAAVEDEVRQLPVRQFTTNTGQFDRIKNVVRNLPAPKQPANPAGR